MAFYSFASRLLSIIPTGEEVVVVEDDNNKETNEGDFEEDKPPEALIIQFDQLIVDEAIDLKCPICLQVLDHPTQCSNGHTYCFTCIQRAIRNNPQCPTCRVPLPPSGLRSAPLVAQQVKELRVYCKYHFKSQSGKWIVDPDGCNHITQSQFREQHEGDCTYRFLMCRYLACSKLYRKSDLLEHEKNCLFKNELCQFCHAEFSVSDIDNHEENCIEAPVKCEHCKNIVLRREFKEHLDACTEYVVSCDMKDEGCQWTGKRSDLIQHISESLPIHYSLLYKNTQKKISNLETLLKQKDDIIRDLENTSSPYDVEINWSVTEFNFGQTYIQSDRFQYSDFCFFVGIHTNQPGDSLGIVLFVEGLKDKVISTRFKISVVNSKDDNKTISKVFKQIYSSTGGFGDQRFMPQSVINTRDGFLHNGTLLVKVQIKIKHTQFDSSNKWSTRSHTGTQYS